MICCVYIVTRSVGKSYCFMMISSPHNPKIKLIRRLLQERRIRQREQLFVVEGTRWLQELVQHQIQRFW